MNATDTGTGIPLALGVSNATLAEAGFGCFLAPNKSVGVPLTLANGSVDGIRCDPGWFCPSLVPSDPSTLPVVCPPSRKCAMDRLLYTPCEAQGKYEPTICKAGYYCPVPSQMLLCPAGSYCPTGSVAPLSCAFVFAKCPAGSPNQQYYGFIVLFAALDGIMLLIVITFRYLKGHLKFIPLHNKELEMSLDIAMKSEATQKDMHAIVEDYRESWGGHHLKMNVSFKKLGVKLRNGTTILEGVSGEIKAKRMTAIMGPSGAGKTTLMNVLMGKVKTTSGDLVINGQHSQMTSFKKLVGYVPQEDVMLTDLTVRENILHSARIRLPNHWKSSKKEDHVDNVIRALHLSNVLNTYIGDENTRGISGGQRKRVNIAMELVAAPLALFLDEPTSGLDATTSLDVAAILKSIANLGLTIVAVVHQPRIEIFKKFDDVILLVPGGRAGYVGPTYKAQLYFEALGYEFEEGTNPADTLMDILAGKGHGRWQLTTNDLADIWENTLHKRQSLHGKIPKHLFTVKHEVLGPEHEQTLEEKETTARHDLDFHKTVPKVIYERGASFLKQFYFCYARSIVQQTRELRGFILETVVATLAGSLIGVAISGKLVEMVSGVYLGKYVVLSPAPLDVIAVCGFLMGVTIGLSGAPSAVKVFGEEKASYWREAASGHNKLAYYLGKTFSTIWRQVISALHFAGCFLYFAKPDIDPVLMFLIVLVQFWGVYGVACLVSLIVRRENASILAVVICLVFSVLCGYGPTLKDAREHNYVFLNYLSFNMWSSEAFYGACISVYKGIFDIEFMAGSWGYALDRVLFDLIICFALGTGMRFIGYILLIGLHRRKQR